MGIFLILAAVVAPLMVMTSLPEPHLTPKVLALVLLLDVSYLWGVMVMIRQKSRETAAWAAGRMGMVVRGVLIAWVVLLGLYSIGGEYGVWGSLLRANGWLIWAHVLLLSTEGVLMLTSTWRARMVRTLAVMGTLVALLGWLGKWIPEQAWFGATGSMISTFGNSSFLAGFLLVTIAATGAVAAQARVKIRRWWIVTAAVQVSALVASDSRAGLLGLMCGLVAAGIWYVAHMSRERSRMVGGVIGVGIALFVAIQFLPASWHLPRGLQIAPSAVTSQTRLLHWRAAWTSITEHPWGLGRGSYPEVFAAQFDPESVVFVGSEAFNDDAHNALLMAGVEMGVVGMVLWLALLGAVLVLSWRVSPWAVGMVVSYGVYLLFTPEQPIVAGFFWMGIASLVSIKRDATISTARWQRWVMVTVALAASVSGVVWIRHGSAFAAYAEAERTRATGRWFPWMEFVTRVGNDDVVASCVLWEKAMQTWIVAAGNEQMAADIRVQTGRSLETRADECTAQKRRFYRTYLLAQFYARQAVQNGNEWMTRTQDTFAQAQSLSPRHPYPAHAYAQFLIETNRVAEAVVQLEQVRTAAPAVRETYVYLYLAYRMAHDEKHAEEVLLEGRARGVIFPEL